ncbi:MAG: hypothetical protein EBS86_13370 [Crocinitomicaceae bacterium]|nr:hypothetical protein [Crocinitomicaceae bacterium]
MKTYVVELVRVFEITSDKDLEWHEVILEDEKLYHTTNTGLDMVMLVSTDVNVIDIVDEEKGDD